jgi:hypothetical protein
MNNLTLNYYFFNHSILWLPARAYDKKSSNYYFLKYIANLGHFSETSFTHVMGAFHSQNSKKLSQNKYDVSLFYQTQIR